MSQSWPEGTHFRLRSGSEVKEVTLGTGGTLEGATDLIAINPESPLGKALVGWLSNPAPSVMVSVKNPVVWEVLAFKLPGGDWVENRPELWEAVRWFGLRPISTGPQDFIPWSRRLEALGALKEDLKAECLERLGFGELSKLMEVIEWVQDRGQKDLSVSKELLENVVAPCAPRIAYRYCLLRLDRGDYWLAPMVPRILRKHLRKPFKAYSFVQQWKDRVPTEVRPALLTAGIGTINHLWNENHTSDERFLEEALSWGKEALAIEEDPYTYCALQAVYRALNQDEEADVCLKRAEELGKPCKDTGRTIRRVERSLSEEAHAPVDIEDPL